MLQFKTIVTDKGKKDLEGLVNNIIRNLELWQLRSCNFQRNVFYGRKGKDFSDDLKETFTAFIIWDDGGGSKNAQQ